MCTRSSAGSLSTVLMVVLSPSLLSVEKTHSHLHAIEVFALSFSLSLTPSLSHSGSAFLSPDSAFIMRVIAMEKHMESDREIDRVRKRERES